MADTAPEPLAEYARKRDFAHTPEPAGSLAPPPDDAPRFVVQEHSATRLHWDLRLERDGVLVSFALPNALPVAPRENHLAVHTEDHPLEYLTFHGDIPKGNYGAGTMSVWDTGTYEVLKWDERKIEVHLRGSRVDAAYALFPLGAKGEAPGKDWMIHLMGDALAPAAEPFPEQGIEPMLARTGALPPAASPPRRPSATSSSTCSGSTGTPSRASPTRSGARSCATSSPTASAGSSPTTSSVRARRSSPPRRRRASRGSWPSASTRPTSRAGAARPGSSTRSSRGRRSSWAAGSPARAAGATASARSS